MRNAYKGGNSGPETHANGKHGAQEETALEVTRWQVIGVSLEPGDTTRGLAGLYVFKMVILALHVRDGGSLLVCNRMLGLRHDDSRECV